MKHYFKEWLENALKDYDKVIFLYQLSKERCIELKAVLEKDNRKFLLLIDADTEPQDFPCSQRKLSEEDARWLLGLYLSYSFADNFVFLTDQEGFPWSTVFRFAEMGLAVRNEVLEAGSVTMEEILESMLQ